MNLFKEWNSSPYIEDPEMEDPKPMQQLLQCELSLKRESSKCEHFQVVYYFPSAPADTIK